MEPGFVWINPRCHPLGSDQWLALEDDAMQRGTQQHEAAMKLCRSGGNNRDPRAVLSLGLSWAFTHAWIAVMCLPWALLFTAFTSPSNFALKMVLSVRGTIWHTVGCVYVVVVVFVVVPLMLVISAVAMVYDKLAPVWGTIRHMVAYVTFLVLSGQ